MSSELKLAELFKSNKRCADCTKPGPSYANLTINSFVCEECSGLLREFGFRVKGLGFSDFTSEEIQALSSGGGNKRVNDIWLGKHPSGPENGFPPEKWSNLPQLKAYLNKKYKEKAWFDFRAIERSSIPTTTTTSATLSQPPPSGKPRTLSTSSSMDGSSFVLASPITTGGRKRVDSTTRGATVAKSFLSRTASNSLSRAPSSSLGEYTRNEDEEGEEEEETLDFTDRNTISAAISDFYQVHNPEKMDSITMFTEWVLYHGMAAFNKKLREKYGTDIELELKNKKKTKKKNPQSLHVKNPQPLNVVKNPSLNTTPPPPNLLDMDLDDMEAAFQQMKTTTSQQTPPWFAPQTVASNPFDAFDAPSSRPPQPVSNNPFDFL